MASFPLSTNFLPLHLPVCLLYKRVFFFFLEGLLPIILFFYQVAPGLNVEFVTYKVKKMSGSLLEIRYFSFLSAGFKTSCCWWGLI